MPLFPLDAVRNARIEQQLEPLLEEIREEIAAFPWGTGADITVDDALGVFDLSRPRLNVLLSLLGESKNADGADISTGLGFLPCALQKRGLNTVATEREVATSRFAASLGIEVRPHTIGHGSPPFAPGSLDFLVLAEVVEHLKMPPVHVLRPLVPLLRPGGRFLLTTPNVARLDHIEALAAGENFLEPFPEALPEGADATDYVEHVREYSIREAVQAVEAAGLAVEQVLMTGWGENGYALHPNPFANDIIVVLAHR